MFNILRYIKIRWSSLRVARAKGAGRCTAVSQNKVEKQVRDLAWLIVQHGMRDPVIDFRIRRHITKAKKVVKYAEISGSASLDGRKVKFTLSNPFPFPFRMVMHVFSGGRSSLTIQGNIHYCFDMLASLGTK